MSSPRVRFSQHALLKFEVLRAHGLVLSQEEVVQAVLQPTSVVQGYLGRSVAQRALDEERVLRVVYEQTPGEVVIVTFYPGRKARYE